MKRFYFAALSALLTASLCFGIRISFFANTETYAERMPDVVIAKCDQPITGRDYGDGLHPVDVSIGYVLKGKSAVGPMRIATIYPMLPQKSYLLSSLGGSVDGITFLAVPELSVVQLPDAFDVAVLKGKTLVEQINLIFAARRAEVERQQQELQHEADLLERALPRKAG